MRNQSLLITACAVLLFLLLLMPSASAVVFVANASYDGSVASGTDAAWLTMRNATGTSVHELTNHTWSGQTYSTGTEPPQTGIYNEHWRGLITWNTSAIPDGATVTSASVSVYGFNKLNQLGTVNFAIIDANPSNKSLFVPEDYNKTSFTRMAADIPYASFSTVSWNNFTLNPQGITNISKTGLTTFMFTHSADVDHSDLTWVNNSISAFDIWGMNYSAGAFTPVITINYDLPAGSALTVNASPTSVTAGTATNVNFTVRNATSTLPVSGALVTLTGVATGSSTTGADGNATINVNATGAGTITATANLTGYTNGTTTVTANAAPLPALTVTSNLTAVTAGTPTGVSFTVRNATSVLSGATVTLSGVATGTGTTGAGGNVTISVNATGRGIITATANLTGYTNGITTVTANAAPGTLIPTKIGVYQNGIWYLDNIGNGTFGAGDSAFSFGGSAGFTPLVGDWNATGNSYIGLTNGQQWYLDWNGNGVFDGADKSYNFGAPGWMNVTGDWNNDGLTDIGVTDGQQWYLDMNNNGTYDSGIDKSYNFGAPGWIPMVGDWNATGNSYIGVTNGQQWYLDWNGNGTYDSGIDKSYNFGAPGWTPIVGDWNATNSSYIGVTNGQQWYLDSNGNGTFDVTDKAYTFGAPGWIPTVGDWNATGFTYIGVTNGQQWYLDWNGNGTFDSGVDKEYNFGAPGWAAVLGKWI